MCTKIQKGNIFNVFLKGPQRPKMFSKIIFMSGKFFCFTLIIYELSSSLITSIFS